MTATFSNLAAANTTGARFEAVNVGGYWQADFGTFRVNGITKNELRAGRVIGMQISGMKNVDLSPGNYTIEIGVKPGTANLQLDDYDSSTAGRVWGAASGSIKVETWGGLGKPAKVSGTVDMEPFAGTGSTGKFTIQFTASVDKIEI